MSVSQKLRRCCALMALCVCLVLAHAPRAAAESIYQPSLDKLQQWGVMNGYADGDMHPERLVSRAQFVAMVNRAYGYDETGKHPFKDVPESAWYFDDVGIAYNAGYFNGTSKTTASPNEFLTRQQAMTLLAKNLRLDEVPGEVTEFVDSHQFSNYAKGYVKAAVEKGLINGYADGTFRPQAYITRGAMAMLLQRALGTLVNDAGTYTLGDVAGNVTIASPDTTLSDTVISGNLYISGGLGLSGVTLDNVRVLGDIIVAGSGESQGGNDSVLLRNVEADRLQVDNLKNQYLSLRAEGDTVINETTVRSDAFIQDRTRAGQGLLNIALEGEDNSRFTLVGNVENVTNKSPNSSLLVAAGSVENLVMDESAVGSRLTVDTNGTVKNLNLDTGVPVSGNGDVGKATINASGTTTAMLPDDIEIRPGITANVAGTTMSNSTAKEASSDPRLLAGYPKVTNIAPTTATATFSANKAGTVYWAVSTVASGSVPEEELISPQTYSTKAVRSGNVRINESNKEVTANLTGMTAGGAYYLASVMVDSRGTHSPVKVVSFSTPDSTVPAFASGYPKISRNSYEKDSLISNRFFLQASVMTNKRCNVYWAAYPSGSTQPTADAFRSGSLAGSIAHGVEPVLPNTIYPDPSDESSTIFRVSGLAEQTPYDLYFWLCDADGRLSSAVKKLSATTVDGTSPQFNSFPTVINRTQTALRLTSNINENGNIYWAAVLTKTKFPTARAGDIDMYNRFHTVPITGEPFWRLEFDRENDEEYARLQLLNKIGAISGGSTSARGGTDATMNVSGLAAAKTYDIYFVARDTAGNYSPIYYFTTNTQDGIPPKASQEFTRVNDDVPPRPFADTDIKITFDEGVRQYVAGQAGASFLELYNTYLAAKGTEGEKEAWDSFASALRSTIRLFNTNDRNKPVRERTSDEDTSNEWVIDYRYATVLSDPDAGTMTVLFKTDENKAQSALNLNSGATYYFELRDIEDISSPSTRMAVTTLPEFETISAEVALGDLNITHITYGGKEIEADVAFTMTPVSTSTVDPDMDWDLLIWADTTVELELYRKEHDKTEWTKYPRSAKAIIDSSARAGTYAGLSMFYLFDEYTTRGSNHPLNPRINGADNPFGLKDSGMIYDYVVHITKLKENGNRGEWSGDVGFKFNVIGGGSGVGSLTRKTSITTAEYNAALASTVTRTKVNNIGTPKEFPISVPFSDTDPPHFTVSYPQFDPEDTRVTMRFQLNRPGTVYYVIAPFNIIERDPSGNPGYSATIPIVPVDSVNVGMRGGELAVTNVPHAGGDGIPTFFVPDGGAPATYEIYSPTYTNNAIKHGVVTVSGGEEKTIIKDLDPKQNYFVYLVTKGNGQVYSEHVEIYQFKTQSYSRPRLRVVQNSTTMPQVTCQNMNATAEYSLFYMDQLGTTALNDVFYNRLDADAQAQFNSDYAGSNLATYQTLKIWEAMAVDAGADGSMFDKYASADYKDAIAAIITAETSGLGARYDGANRTLRQGVADGFDLLTAFNNVPIPEKVRFIFFVVARSSSITDYNDARGHSRAFASSYTYYRPDTSEPTVQDVTGRVTVTYTDKNTFTLSGDMNVVFDKFLSLYDRTTASRQLLANASKDSVDTYNANNPTSTPFTPITSIRQSPRPATDEPNFYVPDPPDAAVTQTDNVDLKLGRTADDGTVTGIRSGSVFSFNRNLSSEFSGSRTETLRITVEYVAAEQQAYAVISNARVWFPTAQTDASGNARIPLSTTVEGSGLPTEVTDVYLDSPTMTLGVGNSSRLSATVAPADADNKAVRWTSSDRSIAMVGSDGTVTGIAGGTAIITVTSVSNPEVTDTCVVTVVSLSVTPQSLIVNAGTTQQLTVEAFPASSTITWTSDNQSVARVNNGVVSGISAGTTTITARIGTHATATVTVTVTSIIAQVDGSTISSGSSLNMSVGDAKRVTFSGSDGALVAIASETSSDSSVATVTGGYITAHKAGTAVITFVSGDNQTFSFTVRVS